MSCLPFQEKAIPNISQNKTQKNVVLVFSTMENFFSIYSENVTFNNLKIKYRDEKNLKLRQFKKNKMILVVYHRMHSLAMYSFYAVD